MDCIHRKHEKNYGMIQPDNGNGLLFVHPREVSLELGDYNPRCGTKVEFDIKPNDRGGEAIHVTAIGGGTCPGGRSTGIWYVLFRMFHHLLSPNNCPKGFK